MRTSQPTSTPSRCPKCKGSWPDYRRCPECKDTRKRCATCRRCPKCGTIKKAKPSGRWAVHFQDAHRRWRRLPAFTDREPSNQLGRKCERLAACVAVGERPDPELAKWLEGIPAETREKLSAWGLIDERASASSMPLAEYETIIRRNGRKVINLVGGHLHDFREHLRATDPTDRYVALTTTRIRRVFDGCGFRYWGDIAPDRVERFLKSLREGVGGKRGISRQTSNFYLSSVKQFARWMLQARRASESPIVHVKALSVHADRRRQRKPLTPSEITRLLHKTYGGPDRCEISGPERAVLYQTAMFTGLRRAELASLTRASFDLDSDEPTVTVEAAYSKHRRQDVVPLQSDLVKALRPHLENKSPAAPALKVPNRHNAAETLREDLNDAGIAYMDDAGRVTDFHALRHTFISSLARAGVHPKTAQSLARHSSITLTMDLYTHTLKGEDRSALESLPKIGPEIEQRLDDVSG